jgi:hypothetical protein
MRLKDDIFRQRKSVYYASPIPLPFTNNSIAQR